MAKVTFDGPNKLIRVNPGVENIDVGSELYSEWKRWVLLDDNAKYLQAFRTLGGDPTNPDETQFAPRYYFLMNGWRVYVDGNTIVFQINLYTDEGVSPFIVENGGAVTNRASDVPNVITELPEIQYSSFGGVVTLDAINGEPGTEFPIGTKAHPVNNADDAVYIATIRGFDTISIIGSYTFSDTDVLDDFILIGQNANKTMLYFPDLCSCIGVEIQECYVTGTLDGGTILRNCVIANLNYINGVIFNCMLNPGTIMLGGNTSAHFLDCWSGQPGTGTPTIDFNFGNNSLGIRGYNGGIKLINKDKPESVSIDLSSGQIKLDSSISQGTIVCRGVGTLTNNTIEQIGLNIISSDLLNSNNIADATMNTDLTNYSEQGTAGEALRQTYYDGFIAIDSVNGIAGTDYPVGTRNSPVNNLEDAFILSRKFNIYRFGFSHDSYTFSATDDLRGYSLFSHSSGETFINITDGCNTENTLFEEVSVHGTLNGRCTLKSCYIRTLFNFEGWMCDCGLNGGDTIKFATNNSIKIIIQDCQSIGEYPVVPVLDFSEVGTEDVTIKGYTGSLSIINKVTDQFSTIVLVQGIVNVADTCTAGTLKISGNGTVIDNSNGTIINLDNLCNPDIISDNVWLNSSATSLIADIEFIKTIEGGRWAISNNQMIFYKEDNTTEIARFDLYDKTGTPSDENVYDRKRV
jgi:hypothetical protein